jgi:hypothetical protein
MRRKARPGNVQNEHYAVVDDGEMRLGDGKALHLNRGDMVVQNELAGRRVNRESGDPARRNRQELRRVSGDLLQVLRR